MSGVGRPVGRRLAGLGRRLATVLAEEGVPGFRARGVYVPYREARATRPLGEDEAMVWLLESLDARSAVQLDMLRVAAGFADRYAAFATRQPEAPRAPRLDQDWFPGLDAAMAYTMVRHFAPARIVEVGSGHSTRWLAQAIADGGHATQLCSIDPQPRRDIDALCDRVLRAPLEQAPAEVFESLEDGDILFIDSSHVALPGSDVELLFTRIVPCLPPGVLVHVHDVFLPFGYPHQWSRRRYNEQMLVAALLAGGAQFEVLAAHHYLRRRHADSVASLGVSIGRGRFESSMWLRTRLEEPAARN